MGCRRAARAGHLIPRHHMECHRRPTGAGHGQSIHPVDRPLPAVVYPPDDVDGTGPQHRQPCHDVAHIRPDHRVASHDVERLCPPGPGHLKPSDPMGHPRLRQNPQRWPAPAPAVPARRSVGSDLPLHLMVRRRRGGTDTGDCVSLDGMGRAGAGHPVEGDDMGGGCAGDGHSRNDMAGAVHRHRCPWQHMAGPLLDDRFSCQHMAGAGTRHAEQGHDVERGRCERAGDGQPLVHMDGARLGHRVPFDVVECGLLDHLDPRHVMGGPGSGQQPSSDDVDCRCPRYSQ
jgi:hypothetical protein